MQDCGSYKISQGNGNYYPFVNSLEESVKSDFSGHDQIYGGCLSLPKTPSAFRTKDLRQVVGSSVRSAPYVHGLAVGDGQWYKCAHHVNHPATVAGATPSEKSQLRTIEDETALDAAFVAVFTPALLAGTLVAEETKDRPNSGDKPEGQRQTRRQRGGRAGRGVRVRTPDIGLTDEQKKEIEGIRETAMAAARDAKPEDRTAIMAKMGKDIYKVFTKEQREKLKKIREAGGSAKQANLRLEVVTFPPNVQAGFKDLSRPCSITQSGNLKARPR